MNSKYNPNNPKCPKCFSKLDKILFMGEENFWSCPTCHKMYNDNMEFIGLILE